MEWLPVVHGGLIILAALIILWGIVSPSKRTPR